MAEIKTRVKLTDKELKEIICKVYNLDYRTASISVNHLPGGPRESEYTEVIVEAKIGKTE